MEKIDEVRAKKDALEQELTKIKKQEYELIKEQNSKAKLMKSANEKRLAKESDVLKGLVKQVYVYNKLGNKKRLESNVLAQLGVIVSGAIFNVRAIHTDFYPVEATGEAMEKSAEVPMEKQEELEQSFEGVDLGKGSDKTFKGTTTKEKVDTTDTTNDTLTPEIVDKLKEKEAESTSDDDLETIDEVPDVSLMDMEEPEPEVDSNG